MLLLDGQVSRPFFGPDLCHQLFQRFIGLGPDHAKAA
ncbi:MAG: hypothetical protein ACI9MU_002348, partial [Alphaproteobacteria bacterium]